MAAKQKPISHQIKNPPQGGGKKQGPGPQGPEKGGGGPQARMDHPSASMKNSAVWVSILSRTAASFSAVRPV